MCCKHAPANPCTLRLRLVEVVVPCSSTLKQSSCKFRSVHLTTSIGCQAGTGNAVAGASCHYNCVRKTTTQHSSQTSYCQKKTCCARLPARAPPGGGLCLQQLMGSIASDQHEPDSPGITQHPCTSALTSSQHCSYKQALTHAVQHLNEFQLSPHTARTCQLQLHGCPATATCR